MRFKKFGNHKKCTAFTLAEVLITLGVIGVVSAMTMPAVIQHHREQITVNKLKKTYSILSQAYQNILFENGNPEAWFDKNLSQYENAKILYEKFKPYLKIVKDCGPNKGCFKDIDATFLDGSVNENFEKSTRAYKVVLSDGTALVFYINYGYLNGTLNQIGCISIDTDGMKGDSVYGKDMFDLYFDEKKIYFDTDVNSVDEKCAKLTGTHAGINCASWVLTYENMDYLHCPQKLSWNGKHSCK